MIEKKSRVLVDEPSHKNAIRAKWVFRTKLNVDGSMNKLKARLVGKNFCSSSKV